MKGKIFIVLIIIMVLTISCQNITTPKPRGYFRIELPEKSYQLYDTLCPFTLNIPHMQP